MTYIRGWFAAALAVATVLAAGLIFLPASAATLLCSGVSNAEVKRCDAGYAADMHKSHWGAYAGHNCANYASWKLAKSGVERPSYRLGNAREWAANAKAHGVLVNNTPAVGAAGVWPGKNHVVFVDEVGSNHLVTSEDNYPGYYSKGMYRKIRVNKGESAYPTQFIHFKRKASPPASTPSAPSGLRSSAQSGSSLSLSWNGVSGAQRYRIQYSKSSSMSGASYKSFTTNAATLTGLDPSTRYYFRVVVVDAEDKDKLSQYTPAPYPSAETKPAGWVATPDDLRSSDQLGDSLSLSWDAVSGAKRYRIQYSKNANMSAASYRSFTTNAATLTGLAPSTRYHFRVVVVDAEDKDKLSEYTPSPYPSAVTKTAGWVATPDDLTSTAQTGSSLALDWDAVDGADRYRIQYSENKSMSGASYKSFTSDSATLTELDPLTRYYFRVVVVDAENDDKLSEYTADPWPSAATKTPGWVETPDDLTSTAQTKSSLTLGWDAVDGAKRYRIQYSKNANMSGASYRSFTTNSATLTGLAPSTKYYFRVVVVDADDKDKLSEYTPTPYPSAATKADTMSTPSNLRSSAQSTDSLSLSWGAVEDAPRYRIQYSKNANMSGASYRSFTTNSATLTGLAPSTRYYFRVVVVDADDKDKLSEYTPTPYPSSVTKAG